MRPDPVRYALTGIHLSEAKAQALEAKLKENPSDIDSRLKLLGYLMQRQFVRPELGRTRVEHVLWFIEHHPDSEVAGSPLCQVHDPNDPAYQSVCDAWDRIVGRPDVGPNVLMNVARYFSVSDPQRARASLELGETIEPTSPEWAAQLGENLLRVVTVAQHAEDQGLKTEADPKALKETALEALAHFERALALAASSARRFQILPRCAQAALEAGRLPDAVRYADETIALAPQCLDDHRPDFLHWAHIVRGRVAFEREDMTTACRELDAAGRQGSAFAPVLRSFGPDFRLARMLLVRGERKAVLSYLERCATFWNPKRISKWRAEIERRGFPLMFTGFDPKETDEIS